MSKECDIVKDLLFSSLEEELSDASKDFIKEHIKNCNDCKKLLEKIEEEKKDVKKEETRENEKQIDYLKSYNKKINLLKLILLILVLSIILASFVIGRVYYKNKADYEYKYNIITAINRPSLQMDKDFKCHIEKTTDYNTTVTDVYYKGDRIKYSYETKYKEEGKERLNQKEDVYGIILGTDKIYKINFREGSLSGYGSEGKLAWENVCYNQMLNYILTNSRLNNDWNSLSKENSLELNIIEDKYEGKDCYVIKRYKKDGGYFEIWIEKESMLVLKINEDEDYVIKFSWEIGTVTDEDLKIENYEVAKESFEQEVEMWKEFNREDEVLNTLKKLFEE